MRRILALLSVLTIAACSGSPASLGITGPGAPPPAPPPPDENTLGYPGIVGPNNFYGPTQSGGRYFNYN